MIEAQQIFPALNFERFVASAQFADTMAEPQ
jgi:hypothetical protein